MNYSQFLNMIPEATLVAVLLIVFFADLFSSKDSERRWLNPLACALLALQIVPCALAEPASAFAGMYVATAAANVMKVILTAGTLIVLIMSRSWLNDEHAARNEGEYYALICSTLLGMYMMISSGHFLLFFLGLEMASVPMACLVAMDKWKKISAEAGAKYVLMAVFSSGVMLFGLSYIYGSTGTLYFEDVANALPLSPMTIMGLVFFFAGLGFKLSLVPFHFWTADTYQGAPTPVTGYLSVISKGAAAFALCTIFVHVFGSMVHQWEGLLYITIVLSITVGNLFAMRQSELKRFMAFSSISQAGYIMLAVVGNSAAGLTALMYYTLIYVVANMAVHRDQRSGREQPGQDRNRRLQRILPDQPAPVVPDDTGPLLAGRYPAVCWYVLQVLRVHGSRRAWFGMGLRRGVHRTAQHRGVALLLSAHCQSHVYQEERQPAALLPQQLQHTSGAGPLHRGHRAVRRRLVHLRVALAVRKSLKTRLIAYVCSTKIKSCPCNLDNSFFLPVFQKHSFRVVKA